MVRPVGFEPTTSGFEAQHSIRWATGAIEADDGNGGSCSNTVQVNVPKSKGKKSVLIDGGPIYDSTKE